MLSRIRHGAFDSSRGWDVRGDVLNDDSGFCGFNFMAIQHAQRQFRTATAVGGRRSLDAVREHRAGIGQRRAIALAINAALSTAACGFISSTISLQTRWQASAPWTAAVTNGEF
ncbi:MAG: hypothetical protein U0793_25135 [Gemmataceae bacterium]